MSRDTHIYPRAAAATHVYPRAAAAAAMLTE